jgi:hypothetical protein
MQSHLKAGSAGAISWPQFSHLTILIAKLIHPAELTFMNAIRHWASNTLFAALVDRNPAGVLGGRSINPAGVLGELGLKTRRSRGVRYGCMQGDGRL